MDKSQVSRACKELDGLVEELRQRSLDDSYRRCCLNKESARRVMGTPISPFPNAGLPDPAVKESSERVRAAIVSAGLTYPRGRLTVNLGPADLHREGPAYDLPIAAALWALSSQLATDLDEVLFVGEVSLDGSVRHVDGILPMTYAAKEWGHKAVYVLQADAPEAALVDGTDVYPVETLARLVNHIRD